MTNTKLLIGSLSNDLYRVANLLHRGSNQGADRFFLESKKWCDGLSKVKLKTYIKSIINDIVGQTKLDHSLNTAEKYLMYSVLLQNYSLHL